MSIAAVPNYLGSIFSTASPGLRFGMYLQLWGVDHGKDGQGKTPIWTTHDLNWRETGKDKKLRQFKDENKTACLKSACGLTANDKAAFIALG
ncbi:MAG: hypothetical protein LBF51_04790, partial [Zoogloeaceae bacterium]|nr:hypothetical protein [Zoogloeaceae bacterium]